MNTMYEDMSTEEQTLAGNAWKDAEQEESTEIEETESAVTGPAIRSTEASP